MTLTEEDKQSYERDLYMKNLPEKDAYFKQLEEAGFMDIQVCLRSYFAMNYGSDFFTAWILTNRIRLIFYTDELF